MDQEINDIASAFNNVMPRDGQAAATGNIPMGGNRLVNVGAAQAANEYLRAREFIENVPIFMLDTTTSTDTVSVSASFFTSVSAAQAPRDGTKVMVRMASHKSSAPVMKFSGHSANIHFAGGGAVDGFVSGAVAELTYNSTEAVWETYSERINPRTSAEAAVAVTPVNYRHFTHPVRDISRYVSDNTGATDVTTAFQAACNVVENEIVVPDGTYLLSSQGTVTYRSAAHAYCVLLKSGTRLQLSPRATIKLADSQNSHIFVNEAIAGAGNTAIEILGGIFDLNQANQTTHATGEQSAALLHSITRLIMRGSRYVNVREYALRITGITAGRFTDLHCTDSDGSGFAFGIASAGLRMVDCTFDQILAESCLGGFAGAVGNGFIFAGDRCQMGSIEQRLCAFGLKIQNDSSDIQAALLASFGTTADHGVKLEGSAAGPLTLTRVTVDNVITSGNYGAGLYMEDYDRVTVRHAKSHGDATSDTYPAIWIGKGDRASVDFDVENACNLGVAVRSDSTNAEISGRVKNSGRTTGSANIDIIGDNCRAKSLHSIQTSGTVTRGLNVNASANHAAVSQLKVDGTFSVVPVQHVQNLSVEQYVRDGSEYVTFADLDATPSVAAGKKFKTFTNALTITDFDDGSPGQEITVISKGAITFDTTGTDLVGSSVDIVTASGDVTIWISDDGTTWRLKGFVDISADNSGGA